MIRAVIFDFGGVISLPQDRDILYRWAEKHTGLTETEIRKGYALFRSGYDHGDYTGAEMYRRILVSFGKPFTEELLAELDRRDSESWSKPNSETYEWARELKATGLKIGILTNMPLAFIPWFEKCASKFRVLADAEVISAAVRMIKPNPEIYREVLSRLGVKAGEAIFFDDVQGNVEGARAVGMNAEVFTSVAKAREDLSVYQKQA